MSAWGFIAAAVLANIATNVMLKKLMAGASNASGIPLVIELVTSWWFWGAAISGVVLVGGYLLAIRTLDLSVSYSIVTASALIGISIASALLLGESLTLVKLAGIALIIAGIYLISMTQGA
ncbi:MAG: hypothetical protein AAFW68_12280 [Pseudomonadota bacterium]